MVERDERNPFHHRGGDEGARKVGFGKEGQRMSSWSSDLSACLVSTVVLFCNLAMSELFVWNSWIVWGKMGQSKNSDVAAYVSRAFQKAFSRPSVHTNLWIFAMGQLESVAFDDSEAVQTTVLDGDRSVRGIVKAIKAGKVKKICVLTGAGISSAAGIPDFRSPGTGIYYNLGKYDLPNPEAMFELDYFKKRPEAFYHFIKVWILFVVVIL